MASLDQAEMAARRALIALPRRLATFLKNARAELKTEHAILDAIQSGRVLINSTTATSADDLVLPGDDVTVDGVPYTLPMSLTDTTVFAFFKPAGMACTTDFAAPRGLGGVAESFGHTSLHCVGRLDKSTTGLLLFTDDGDLTRLLLLPGNVSKTYVVGFDAPANSPGLSSETLDALRQPASLPRNHDMLRASDSRGDTEATFETLSEPVLVEPLLGRDGRDTGRGRFECRATISSGQNHIIKRLFVQQGVHVRWLHREAIGPVDLSSLNLATPGSVVRLAPTAVSALWESAGGARRLLEVKRTELAERLSQSPEDARIIADGMAARGLGALHQAADVEAIDWMVQTQSTFITH